MFDFIASLLSFFYDVWPSYGGAIVLLTLLIMLVFSPLQIKSTRSMLQMQRLQPEIKRLQAKHKGDRDTLNRELMALYQANGVNPLGGCLPVLLQIPVFIVMFQVLRGLTNRVSDTGLALGASLIRGSDDQATAFAERTFDPRYLDQGADLYQALHGSTEMKSWGLDLSSSARSVLSDSFIDAVPYLLLVVVVGVTAYVQQRQIMARNSGSNQAMNPQQQAIMKFLPFMLPVFSFSFPAGLVVYFVVSNLIRIGQQAFISRRVYGPMRSEDHEIVLPDSAVQEKSSDRRGRDTESAKPARSGSRSGGSSKHGRRPVDVPKKRATKQSSRPVDGAKKHSGQNTRSTDAVARPTSGRVTPKGETAPRKRKKKR